MSQAQDQTPVRKKKRGEVRRTLWALVALLVVVAAVAAAWVRHVWAHSDRLLETAVRQHLQQLAPGWQIRFSRCRFDLLRRVRLDNVTFQTSANAASTTRPLVSISTVFIAIDRQALAEQQRLVIQKITLQEPLFHLDRNARGHWNWQTVTRPPAGHASLPEWKIVNGRVDVAIAGGKTATVGLKDIRLQLVPSGTGRYILDADARDSADSPRPTRLTLSGRINVAEGILSLSGEAGPLAIDRGSQDLLAALWPPDHQAPSRRSPVSTLADTLGSVDLSGEAQVAFRLARWAPKGDWDYRLLLDLKHGRLSVPGLPWTLDELAGKLYCDTRHLQVKQLVGREASTGGAAGARIEINGLLDRTASPPAGHCEVVLRGITLDRRLRLALPSSWRPLFDSFAPSGRVDITSTLKPTASGSWQPTDSVVTADGCGIRHARFPYPLRNIAGTLTQVGASRDVRVHFDATAGERPVSIRGLIEDAGPAASSQIDITVTRLPIDETLRAAVRPSVKKTLDTLDLRGALDIHARLMRPAGLLQQTETRLSARLRDASIRFAGFPWSLADLEGKITAVMTPTSHRWDFQELVARHGTARLTGEGNYRGTPGQSGRFALDIEARGVVLDGDLRAACKPELKQLWDTLAVQGQLEARIEIRRDGHEPHRVTIPRFLLEQGAIRLKGFPYPLRDVTVEGDYGLLDPDTRRLTIKSFAGRHGETRVASEGTLDVDPRRDWTLRLDELSVQGLVADKVFRKALPKGLKEVVASLDPQGPLDLSGLIELRGAGEPGFPITAAWNIDTRLSGNRLTAGVHLDNVKGRIRSRGKWFGSHAVIDGQFELDGVSVWGFRFGEVRGPFHLQDHDLIIGSSRAFATPRPGRTWQPIPLEERVTARAVGGLFTLDAHAQLDGEPTYHIKMNMSEARLENFARTYLKDPRKLKGLMRGWVDLRGKGHSPDALAGRGQLQVSPAELYELPIIIQLFDTLSLGPPEPTAFRYAQCDFQLARSQFHFKSIDLVGNSLQLRGRGTAGFDGRIALDFYSMLPNSRIPIPFLQPLLGSLTTGWVAVRVHGQAGDPKASVRPAPVLDDALKRFLSALENPAGRRTPPPLLAPFSQRPRRPATTSGRPFPAMPRRR